MVMGRDWPAGDPAMTRTSKPAADQLALFGVYNTASDLINHPAFAEAVRLYLQPPRRQPISSWSSLGAYLQNEIASETREQFRVMFLDVKNCLIVDEIQGHGTVSHAPVYPREVIRRALELAASGMVLVHNHPSGDPTPSTADINITRQIVDAAKVFGIQVFDHCVVGSQGVASMKALGLM
jgi:DNA repair protein RadC